MSGEHTKSYDNTPMDSKAFIAADRFIHSLHKFRQSHEALPKVQATTEILATTAFDLILAHGGHEARHETLEKFVSSLPGYSLVYDEPKPELAGVIPTTEASSSPQQTLEPQDDLVVETGYDFGHGQSAFQ